jgi:hypothetical protein
MRQFFGRGVPERPCYEPDARLSEARTTHAKIKPTRAVFTCFPKVGGGGNFSGNEDRKGDPRDRSDPSGAHALASTLLAVMPASVRNGLWGTPRALKASTIAHSERASARR